MSNRHWLSMIAGGLFVLCGVIRLGYFNVMEHERQKQTEENSGDSKETARLGRLDVSRYMHIGDANFDCEYAEEVINER